MQTSAPRQEHTFFLPALAFVLAGLLLMAPLPALAGEPTGLQPFAGDGPQGISLTATLFKAVGSLAVVLALLFLLLFLLKKSGLARNSLHGGGLIRILDLRALAPRKQVAVLEVAGEYIVVGIAEQQLTLLHTLAGNEPLRQAAARAAVETPALPPSFAALLKKAGEQLPGRRSKSAGGPHAS
jgi:flagellar protein FliO/FliZ